VLKQHPGKQATADTVQFKNKTKRKSHPICLIWSAAFFAAMSRAESSLFAFKNWRLKSAPNIQVSL
jgi:hypothetical protein